MVVEFYPLDAPKGVIVKRPVKPKEEHVRVAMLKRKPKVVTVSKNIQGGSLSDIAQQVMDFATANHVAESDVKFAGTGYYSNPHLKAKRLETEEEFFKRVKYDLDVKYQHLRWQYEDYLRQERRRKADVEAARRATLAAAGKCPTCGK